MPFKDKDFILAGVLLSSDGTAPTSVASLTDPIAATYDGDGERFLSQYIACKTVTVTPKPRAATTTTLSAPKQSPL